MAKAAAGLIPRAAGLTDQDKKALRTRYRQLRIMLHSAGLAATYAFVAARAGSGQGSALSRAYDLAARGVRERLADLDLLTGDLTRMDAREVLRQLGEMDGTRYARASAEAAALVSWLSRLADATYQEERSEAGAGHTHDAGQARTP